MTGVDWDHPDVFADRAAVIDAFEAWLRRMADGSTLVVNIGDPGGEAVVDRLRERAIAVVAYALVDASPGRGGYLRGIGERYATAAGPAGALLGRIVTADAGGTTLEVHGLDPLAGATTIRLATAGRHNAANALAVAGAALSLGVAPERDRGRHRVVRRRRPAPGAQGRGGRRRGLRRLRPPPDRDRRDARRRSPARAGTARLGGLRAPDLPSDRGHAGCLRGGAGRRGRGRRGGHLGRPGP